MRRGTHDVAWLDDEDIFIGCNLGWDFCAEHEWGVKRLSVLLGIEDKPVMGIERRRVGQLEDGSVKLVEGKKSTSLFVDSPWNSASLKDGEISFFDKDLATAWYEGGLAIHVKGKDNISRVKELHEAILNKDAAVWLGGGKGFGNAGLIVAIISKVPEHLKQQMYDADVAVANLQEASNATGIKQKLDEINKKHFEEHKWLYSPVGYYALSPRWTPEHMKEKTKYKVVYWLNPMGQDKNKYGWYTVEELELWIKGTGPVVKESSK